MGNIIMLTLEISKEKNGEKIRTNLILFIKDTHDADLYYFGDFIDKERKFVIIAGPNNFRILNLYNNKIIGAFKPKFFGVGADAQSGMLSDLKIIMDGRFIIGYCVDSGTFLFDLTNLYKPKEIFSVNIPYTYKNHFYILPNANDKQLFFGLYVSEENWKVNSKIIFTNKKVEGFNDYSELKQASEIEIEEKLLSNFSEIDSQYVIFKEILTENDYRYLVFDVYNVKFINLPTKLEKSNPLEIKEYLKNIKY